MTTLNERQHTGEFILSECPGTISRENVTVTVPASTTLAAGTVLGRISATGKFALYHNIAADGTESAAGVLYGELVNAELTPVDMDGVVINFGAEVRKADLQWKAGTIDADKTLAYVDLAANGVKARD